MLTISESLTAHLAQEVTTLATCWHITCRDGTAFRFTDHDADLQVDDALYMADSGMTPSAVSSELGLTVDNGELQGLLSESGISQAAVLSGKLDHAVVNMFMVNYQDPSGGSLPLKRGWLGEVTLQGQRFVAEIRGVSALLQQPIGAVYTHSCRAKLGDARCGVELAAFTVTGTVTAVVSQHQFSDDAREEANHYFAYGQVLFTSGANSGLHMEVRAFGQGQFTLFLPMPHPIALGDTYQAVAGCDKLFASCTAKFANAVNFRGEPHVPGMDKLLETSATRSP